MKIPFILSICFLLFVRAHAQNGDLLHTPLPATKEEFTASEPNVINTVNYLETSSIDKEGDVWRAQASLLIQWISGSPQVKIEMREKILTFIKKNPELMAVYLGGWTKFVLQNNYSSDQLQGNLAGLRSAIKVYKAGNGLKKDKEMDKYVKMEETGGLEVWVSEQLTKK